MKKDIIICNLTNNNEVLNLHNLIDERLYGCKLQGTTLLVGEDFDKEQIKNNMLSEDKLDWMIIHQLNKKLNLFLKQ